MPAFPSLPARRPFTQPYDRAEVIADTILHAIAIGLAIPGVVFLLCTANGLPGFQSTSIWAYGLGLLIVFATSAAYNVWPVNSTKLVLRRFDQSAIFLFIAASYTPFVSQTDHNNAGLLIAIWGVACSGVILKFAFPGRFDLLSVSLCLALGWSGLLAYDEVFSRLPAATLNFIIAGGVLYSVGVVFHLWDGLRFQNVIWHAFVISAAAFQFAAVFNWVSAAVAATGLPGV